MTVTLAADVVAWLKQDEVNASRAVDNAIRQNVADHAIREAAEDAGMSDEEISEARRS